MEYKDYMKDGLTKMADVLREQNLAGEKWAMYMGIKSYLLKRHYLFMMDSAIHRSLNKIHPLVRVRDGKVVWHGVEDGDFLSKTDILDMEYLSSPEKHGFKFRKVEELQQIGEATVWFPSEDNATFIPSSVQVLQQIPEGITVDDLLFEIRLLSAKVCDAYDPILGCHQAKVIFYRLVWPKFFSCASQRDRILPEYEEKKKDECGLNDIKVNEVRKVNAPKGPMQQPPIPLR